MYQRTETAFKHPGCGGLIYSYEWPERTRYRCGRCFLWGDDLVEMALGLAEKKRRINPAEFLRAREENHGAEPADP